MVAPIARKAASRGTHGAGRVTARNSHETTTFRFLDLPAEIRLEIYGYYAYAHKLIPPENDLDKVQTRGYQAMMEATREGLRGMKETRKSLLLVSKQVSEEWAPIFWNATAVVVNPLKLDSDSVKLVALAMTHRTAPMKPPRHTTKEFKKLFLCKANLRLKYVTMLKYDCSSLLDLRENVENGMVELTGILHAYYLQLPSLKKITFHARNPRPRQSYFIPNSQVGDMLKSFKALGMGSSLADFEQKLVLFGSRTGRWTSTRKMKYGGWLTDLRDNRYWEWDSFKIVCRREHEWC